jgi:hypothetical protein
LVVTLAVLLVDLWHTSMPLVNVSAVDVSPLWQLLQKVTTSSPQYRVAATSNTLDAPINSPNDATYTHHLSIGGYEQLIDARYAKLLNATMQDPTTPIAKLLGVRYALSNTPLADHVGQKLLVQDQSRRIYELSNDMPRAFIVAQAQVVPRDEDAIAKIMSGEIDPRKVATADQKIDCGTSNELGSANITNYVPNAVTVSINNTTGGLLVLSDTYDAGWSARVDGAPAKLWRVDVALRGVCVPAGARSVEFVFSPRILWVGAAVSAGACVALLLIALFALRRHSPHK